MTNDFSSEIRPVKPWLNRALKNGLQLLLVGGAIGALFPVILTLLGMTRIGQESVTAAQADNFLTSLYSTYFGRVVGIAIFAAVLGFIAGVSATPSLDSSRNNSHKKVIVYTGAAASVFILGAFGPAAGLGYFEAAIVF